MADASGPPAAIEQAPPTVIAPKRGGRRRRLLGIVAGILGVLLLWWGSGYVLAYTDDAYLTSDFVRVASEITGPVVEVAVADNQAVARGTLLFRIDPTPFALELAKRRADVAQTAARIAVDEATLGQLQAREQVARAQAQLAQHDCNRDSRLLATSDVPREMIDNAAATLREAQARVEGAEGARIAQERSLAEHCADVAA